MLGLRACEIPTHPKEGVCLEELARRLARTRIKACVFMTNFSNPLGSCLPDEKKRRLVELLATRGVPLIEDDIYGSVAFGPVRPAVAKSFDLEGMVLCQRENHHLFSITFPEATAPVRADGGDSGVHSAMPRPRSAGP